MARKVKKIKINGEQKAFLQALDKKKEYYKERLESIEKQIKQVVGGRK